MWAASDLTKYGPRYQPTFQDPDSNTGLVYYYFSIDRFCKLTFRANQISEDTKDEILAEVILFFRGLHGNRLGFRLEASKEARMSFVGHELETCSRLVFQYRGTMKRSAKVLFCVIFALKIIKQ